MEQQTVPKQEVRAWCDGCYDMVHFGHANSLRQAKKLADKLIVGIHSDEEIAKHKGPPVFTQEERCKLIRGIKWVDEVIEDAPYVTSLDTLDKYNCSFSVHGDDLTMTADGVDCYQEVKLAKRYREVKRTAGVSTTNLVKRILSATRCPKSENSEPSESYDENATASSPWTGSNQFLLTTHKIAQFCNPEPPKSNDKIVYVTGDFDLFHVGHLEFLERAKSLGDYLIVGLHSDGVVNSYKGGAYPIQSLNERALSVLACKYVDDIIFGAPLCINLNLMGEFKIDLVCHGSTLIPFGKDEIDPYAVPRSFNKFIEIDVGSDMTTEMIVERILKHRLQFVKRNQEKEQKEKHAYEAFKSQVKEHN